jgi:2-phospho-L-lactate guanylyltransferase
VSSDGPGCWVIIPAKARGTGKARLAGVLDAAEREHLVAAMLARVVAAAQSCEAVRRVCLVGSAPLARPGVTVLADPGGGLNPALGSALGQAAERRPERVVIVAGDLPQVTSADLAMMACVPGGAIAIAPDRHGTGTNALSLPLDALGTFTLQFGIGSHAAHRAEAVRLGYSVETMLSAGLEKDIDEPADLPDATGCLQEALQAPEGK